MESALINLNSTQTKKLFIYVGEKVIESKYLLTKMDSAIGDGDHGIGMSRGFSIAIENLNKQEFSSINDVFKIIGMSMISSMGGASGIIFGTLFVGGIKGMNDKELLNLPLLAEIFSKAVDAIKQRGGASLGDKTMIDALQPAAEALVSSAADNNSLFRGLQNAEISAKQGVENTKNYIAKFGRAKFLGERTIGYPDAGATTVWIIFKSMREWVEGYKK
jgi:dihydroxyacetone kinase phosphoprotein-dependent L subunit